MKKRFVLPLAALLATAACSDGAQNPLALQPGIPAFGASHGTIPAPALTPSVSGMTVALGWSWSDATDWELVSFKVTREGALLTDAIPNAKPYTANTSLPRSVSHTESVAGTYTYCVEVMAKNLTQGPGREETHHSTSCAAVTVGAPSFSILAVGGNCQTGTAPNTNASTWNLSFQLYEGGVLVGDGRDVYANGVKANYAADKNEYHINAQGSAGASEVVWNFTVDPDGASAGSFTCTAPTAPAGMGKGRK